MSHFLAGFQDELEKLAAGAELIGKAVGRGARAGLIPGALFGAAGSDKGEGIQGAAKGALWGGLLGGGGAGLLARAIIKKRPDLARKLMRSKRRRK